MAQIPTDTILVDWHKRFACECNNRAWQLAEMPARAIAEDDEMLMAACSAAWHWNAMGTPHEVALAQLLLGQAMALLGLNAPALRHSRAAFEFITGNDSPPWEVAFAHAVLSHASAAAGEVDAHRSHHALAQSLGNALADQEEREIFEATFRQVPLPLEIPQRT